MSFLVGAQVGECDHGRLAYAFAANCFYETLWPYLSLSTVKAICCRGGPLHSDGHSAYNICN